MIPPEGQGHAERTMDGLLRLLGQRAGPHHPGDELERGITIPRQPLPNGPHKQEPGIGPVPGVGHGAMDVRRCHHDLTEVEAGGEQAGRIESGQPEHRRPKGVGFGGAMGERKAEAVGVVAVGVDGQVVFRAHRAGPRP